MNTPICVSQKNVAVLTDQEIDQVSGAIVPLVIWGLWTLAGVGVGYSAAYVATHWK